MKKLTSISLFSGCGGLDLGFEAAGFNIRLAVDNMKEACETLAKNKPNMKVYGPPKFDGDAKGIDSSQIKKLAGLKSGEIDMVIGGPPCQSFSVAAAQRFLKTDKRFKRKGFKCNDRGMLVFEYLRLVRKCKPKAFLMENVPGILTVDGGRAIDFLLEQFRGAGYHIYGPHVLEASDYGVPQLRRRIFIIGSLTKANFSMPEKIYADGLNLFSNQVKHTVAQALVDLPENTANHMVREHKKQSIARYKTLKFGKREMLGRVDRLDPNKPSKTVIAGGSSGGGRSHLHPYIARTLSVRECARLQTFPDSYVFYGKVSRQFTLVGNAVPPLLAEVLARRIGEAFFDKRYGAKPLQFAYDYLPQEEANRLLRVQLLEKSPDDRYYDIDAFQESEMASIP